MLTFIDRPNAIAYSTIACSRRLSQQLDERFDLPHVLDQGGEPPPPACAVSLPQGRHQPCALANLSEITGGNPGPLGRADLGPRGTVRVQLAEHVWEAHFFGCCCCSLSLMGWGWGWGELNMRLRFSSLRLGPAKLKVQALCLKPRPGSYDGSREILFSSFSSLSVAATLAPAQVLKWSPEISPEMCSGHFHGENSPFRREG